MRDKRYDILFEPVKIGPVTSKNRFFQVPHCTGMGHRYPQADAAHRAVKAEGGWGVICTQEAEIHPTSDISPANEARLWNDGDIPALRLVTDAVHAHGALSAIQLVHNGLHVANRYSRLAPIGPSHAIVDCGDPVQARAMDKSDIKRMRGWYVDAARRARTAGFDIVYLYAGHDMTVLQHFLLSRHNHRTDEYGGSFENRLRLFREVIGDVRDAVGDTCGIAVRLAVDELMGAEGLTHDGEARDVVTALAEEPDLWDVNLSGWSNDSQTSRFSDEGFQEEYTAFVKSITTKPVVGVGRYTSPDSMVRVIRQGRLDLIGAARPSIADPYLPRKIEEGRIDDIRECIGCNICVAGDNLCVPMRCTQNPTVGEEWRRGWHPEVIRTRTSPDPVLVIGGGPAGLEATRALAQRGGEVTLAEGSTNWGGRVRLESRLPGLAAWSRVSDWRLGQLHQYPNAQMYLESQLAAQDVLEFGIPNIAVATGAHWRTDGVGRSHNLPLDFLANGKVVSPDEVIRSGAAACRGAEVVIYDDEGFYLATVLAEVLAAAGKSVTLVTSDLAPAMWSQNTLEFERINTRMHDIGARIVTRAQMVGRSADGLDLSESYSGRRSTIACDTLVPVTSRLPQDELVGELMAMREQWADFGIESVTAIGDCEAPGLIAHAVYAGHKFGREFGESPTEPKQHRFG